MRTRDLATTARAQTLRIAPTDAERKLWGRLRDRRLNGAKFVRQFPAGPYFADFACRQSYLIVEVDGSQHAESAHDEKRDAFLLSQGYAILRFWNADVTSAIDDVCDAVLAALEGRLEPYERFKAPTSNGGAAPHPALRATFSPLSGEKGSHPEQTLPEQGLDR